MGHMLKGNHCLLCSRFICIECDGSGTLLCYKAIIGCLRAVLTRRGRLEAQWVELILVSVEIVMLEKLDCVISKRATRPYIYESTSVNACVRIYE
jgi:hypothetical protein